MFFQRVLKGLKTHSDTDCDTFVQCTLVKMLFTGF